MTRAYPVPMHSDVPETPDEARAASDAVRTGVAEVDRVIGGLDRLDDLPVEAHAGLFETAHAALREALEAPHTQVPLPTSSPTSSPATGSAPTEQDGA